jgi:hypothetical protein
MHRQRHADAPDHRRTADPGAAAADLPDHPRPVWRDIVDAADWLRGDQAEGPDWAADNANQGHGSMIGVRNKKALDVCNSH